MTTLKHTLTFLHKLRQLVSEYDVVMLFDDYDGISFCVGGEYYASLYSDVNEENWEFHISTTAHGDNSPFDDIAELYLVDKVKYVQAHRREEIERRVDAHDFYEPSRPRSWPRGKCIYTIDNNGDGYWGIHARAYSIEHNASIEKVFRLTDEEFYSLLDQVEKISS